MSEDGGRSVAKAIGWGVVVCGTLDILDAIVFSRVRNGVSAERVLQYVASGVLGPASFRGGWGSAMVGLAVHYAIAATWVALFVLLAQRVRWMSRQPVLAGLLWGAVVYVVMNDVVLGFTRIAPRKPQTGIALVNAWAALVLLVGLGVGLVNWRFAPRPERKRRLSRR